MVASATSRRRIPGRRQTATSVTMTLMRQFGKPLGPPTAGGGTPEVSGTSGVRGDTAISADVGVGVG